MFHNSFIFYSFLASLAWLVSLSYDLESWLFSDISAERQVIDSRWE